MSAPSLADWYRQHGRHQLPWRRTRDRYAVLVSEVMLQQTQVVRVEVAWPSFMARFPVVEVLADAPLAEVLTEWGRLGYPRRARRLWESAQTIAAQGWPADLTVLPGIGRYTADAVAAQVDAAMTAPVETNVKRVLARWLGRPATLSELRVAYHEAGSSLTNGRDRLLALMDLGALRCKARTPECDGCPLYARCAARGTLADEARPRQAPFEGSFRQRRGRVLAVLRAGPVRAATVDQAALRSLVDDGLAVVDGLTARLP